MFRARKWRSGYSSRLRHRPFRPQVRQAGQTLLIFDGAFNGLILPVGFGVLLWVAWRRRDLLQGYEYPKWLLVIGAVTWVLTVYLGWNSLAGLAALWA